MAELNRSFKPPYKPGPPLRFERCSDCGLIHFVCGVCGTTRTILKEPEWHPNGGLIQGERAAIHELRQRADLSSLHIHICDGCWPKVLDQRIPVVDPNGYVKPKPTIFIYDKWTSTR